MVYDKFHVIVLPPKTITVNLQSFFQPSRVWWSEEDNFEMVYGKFTVIVLPPKAIMLNLQSFFSTSSSLVRKFAFRVDCTIIFCEDVI
jgi:hypothetical protein